MKQQPSAVGRCRAAEQGTTILSISPELPDGGYIFGHTRSYPKEYLATGPNEPLLRSLAEIGQGRYAPEPAQVFELSPTPERTRQDITDWLLIAFLVLLPVDIWLRRRAWGR